MKILIDSRGASFYRGTGIGTYTHNFLKTLINIDKKNDYHLFCSGPDYNDYKSDNTNIIMSSKKHKTFFEEFYMPTYATDNKVDIYHVPQNGMGIQHSPDSTLNIATIHDLIPYILPETTGKRYLKNFLRYMPEIIEKSDGILTVSEYSKKDILRFFPSFPAERIFVTPLAANLQYKPLDKEKDLINVQNRFNFTGNFIMYIGGFSPRKNVQGLLESFNKIYKNFNEDVKLLIVGGLRDEGIRLKNLSQTFEFKDKIIFTGFIEEEYLPTLYRACSLFVYPSLYEGFGLPPLESMSCGTPVLASNVTSIPEVVLNSDLLFNPYNNAEFETKLINFINNINLKDQYSKEALEIASKFSWKKTSELTLKAYEEIYKMGKKI